MHVHEISLALTTFKKKPKKFDLIRRSDHLSGTWEACIQCHGLHMKTLSKGYHRQAYVLWLAVCIVWMVAIATDIYTANMVTKHDTGLFTGSNFFTVLFWDIIP